MLLKPVKFKSIIYWASSIFIHSFIYLFAQQVTHIQQFVKTYCKMSWKTRQTALIVAHDCSSVKVQLHRIKDLSPKLVTSCVCLCVCVCACVRVCVCGCVCVCPCIVCSLSFLRFCQFILFILFRVNVQARLLSASLATSRPVSCRRWLETKCCRSSGST